MGHSLRPDNLTITPDFVISDGTHNTGYVLVSATGGVASWKNTFNLPGFQTKHYIGELWAGGVVAAVWKENDVEKCLITSLSDHSIAYSYFNPFDESTNTYTTTQYQWSTSGVTGSATSSYDGLVNTNYILNQLGSNAPAATYCANYKNPNYNTGTFSDWYLPSVTEMAQVVNNSFKINYAIKKYAMDNSKTILAFDSNNNTYVNYISKYLQQDGQFAIIDQSNNSYYWTSTEVMNSGGRDAYTINMSNNTPVKTDKNNNYAIRPVRIASETTIITAFEFTKSVGANYTIALNSQISGYGDFISEIGSCWNGPYSPSAGYGTGPDKLAIPLPTINDNKIVATMIYDPNIGFGYGVVSNIFTGVTFSTSSKYSVREYVITSKGDVKYGEQLVL